MIGYHIKEALRGFAVLAFLGAVIFLALRCQGCTPAEQQAVVISVENAAAVKQYDDALVECQQAARQKPKELRFEAYVDCEQSVSKAFCQSSGELRDNWSRCKELSQ
jgi:hypothetical protein